MDQQRLLELAAKVDADDTFSPTVAAELLRRHVDGDAVALGELATVADVLDALAGLLRHMDVHSAYRYGGYAKMTSEQRALYRAATGWSKKGPPAFDTPTGYLE